jgi:hypothetical protein
VRPCNLVGSFLLPVSSVGYESPRKCLLRKGHYSSAVPGVVKTRGLQGKCLLPTILQTAQPGGMKWTSLNMKPESSKFPQSYNLLYLTFGIISV